MENLWSYWQLKMTTYIALSDGSYLTTSDGMYLEFLPDSVPVSYDALYAQWIKEGSPRYFTYNFVVYMQVNQPDIEFIKIARGEYPERADGSKTWDGLYGPYGRQWWLNTHKGQPVS